MRIAVVADVHGNLTALEAVVADLRRQAPDLVLHGGDLPLCGARPAAVVDRIRELGWPGVRGNTDEVLWVPALLAELAERQPGQRALWRTLGEIADQTNERLGEDRIAWLRGLPSELRAGRVAVVHASPGDLWRAPLPEAADAELAATYETLGAPVVAYGHIHRSYVRQAGGRTIANCGSLSLSHDGDPRAAYLLVDRAGDEDGAAAAVVIRRVEYDLDREAAALLASGLARADWLCASLRAARPVPLPEAG